MSHVFSTVKVNVSFSTVIIILWPPISVENENHCDFVKLREMLIRTNMEDLREQTHQSHYELYRRNRLQEMGFSDMTHEGRSIGLGETFEQKRAEHQQVKKRAVAV